MPRRRLSISSLAILKYDLAVLCQDLKQPSCASPQPRGRGVGRGPSRKAYLGAPRPEWAVAALVDGVPWGEEHLHTLYTHSHNTMSGVEFRGAFTSQTRNGTSLCDG